MSGKIVHFEMPADDMERAQTFYRDAFGWQLTLGFKESSQRPS